MTQKAASSAVHAFVQAVADGCVSAVKFMESFWMQLPSPDVASGGGSSWSASPVIADMQSALSPFTALVAVVSFAVALARIGWTQRVSDGTHAIGRQIVALVASTTAAAAITELLLQAGDAFSPWILDRAGHGGASGGLDTVLSASLIDGTQGLGLWLVLFLLALIGAVVQCVFMVIRGAALIVLMVLLPSTAAGAASEEGWVRLKRLFALILGFALYKPVAAIIYATGLRLMSGGSGNDSVRNAIYGLAVIVMAALALPAFIKFLMPLAAMGSSSVFSGGAAIGAVAAGAAVVGLGGGSGLAARGAAGGSPGGAVGAPVGGAAGGGGSGGPGGGLSGGPDGGPGGGPAGGAGSPSAGSAGGGDGVAGGGDAAAEPVGAGVAAASSAGGSTGGSGGGARVGSGVAPTASGGPGSGSGSGSGAEPATASAAGPASGGAPVGASGASGSVAASPAGGVGDGAGPPQAEAPAGGGRGSPAGGVVGAQIASSVAQQVRSAGEDSAEGGAAGGAV